MPLSLSHQRVQCRDVSKGSKGCIRKHYHLSHKHCKKYLDRPQEGELLRGAILRYETIDCRHLPPVDILNLIHKWAAVMRLMETSTLATCYVFLH